MAQLVSKSDSTSVNCRYPLNGWLLGTYLLIGSLRLAFMFYEGAEKCVKLISFFMMLLFMPAVITWTVLGTVWFSLLENA